MKKILHLAILIAFCLLPVCTHAQENAPRQILNQAESEYEIGRIEHLDKIKEVLSSLPGKIHIYIGNHDTQSKIDLYKSLPNVVEVVYANEIKHGKRTYYVSHYRTDVSCLECSPKTSKINIHGHIHTKQIHYEDIPYFINVSVDAQNGKLVTFDDIEKMFNEQVKKCIDNL